MQGKSGKAYTGDYDVFEIEFVNQKSMDPKVLAAKKAELLDRMNKDPDLATRHGAHVDWKATADEIKSRDLARKDVQWTQVESTDRARLLERAPRLPNWEVEKLKKTQKIHKRYRSPSHDPKMDEAIRARHDGGPDAEEPLGFFTPNGYGYGAAP
ncbi:MAG TPA: hypothetical protein VHL98_15350 [Microvirga sp.]|jgi:hypothetical protein|nr:hypothetical protein [Microvirga sp.]